jgi:hypothetical protein
MHFGLLGPIPMPVSFRGFVARGRLALDAYSPFMLAALTIGHHFSISAF